VAISGNAGIPIKALLDECGPRVKLKLLNSQADLTRRIAVAEIDRPGLALSGYFETFAGKRLQVLGLTEISYLKTKDKTYLQDIFQRLTSEPIPGIVIARRLKPPKELVTCADRQKVPLLSTPLRTSEAIALLSDFLRDKFAPQTSYHGELLDIFGVGIMILGESGLGKSECALDLVAKGHRLVADDQVIVKRIVGGLLVGYSDPKIKDHIEIQGLGIISISRMYGVQALRDRKRIEIVIRLEPLDPEKEYERTGLADTTIDILGVEIPYLVIPIIPGKNIANIVEAAALNHLLRIRGIHTAREFNKQLIRIMTPEETKPENPEIE
jgi:HPr kinase/phosphorylase